MGTTITAMRAPPTSKPAAAAPSAERYCASHSPSDDEAEYHDRTHLEAKWRYRL